MIIASVSQFHNYLSWVNARLALCLKCKSACKRFQLEEGPSRGFLRVCEIFVDGSFAALVSSSPLVK